MKVSLNWLNELVELPQDATALAELLTKAGVEVEGIEHRGVAIDNVVVAQVLESRQHPNADRLSVCRVDDGSAQPRQIVCGAKNYKVGDKIPLAQPGAVLPGEFKIKVGKLRGVESEGMMCSGKELGVDDGVDGLLILPESAVVGTPISALFPSDTILDLEVTPNRPDLLCHIGMAREIATLLEKPLRLPRDTGVPPAIGEPGTGETPGSPLPITLEAGDACPFYAAQIIRGVKVGPSPAWLRSKLEAVGIRSINNIVDVTNFIMMEMGQPLHAFDLAKLHGGIRVRNAAEGEQFLALDGRTYTLAPRHMMIADRQKAVAIAGVMGGEDTGVTASTVNILLESAYFAPASIRRTSRELGLPSDASYRFERGIDPETTVPAAARATELILQVAGGTADPALEAAGAVLDFRRSVPFRLERCQAVLGTEVSAEQVRQILTGFGLTAQGTDGAQWLIPSFRQDLSREIDLIEEVARVIGIEAVPAREYSRFSGSSEADKRADQAMRLRRALAAQGYYEARGLTLISERALAGFPVENVLRVRNPLNEDQVVLRPSLIPGLLETVGRNVRGGVRNLRLFEVGRVFRTGAREERTALALVLTGEVGPASWRDSKPRPADFFDLKGALAGLNLGALTFQPIAHPALALAVEICRGETAIGLAGQLLPTRARELDAPAPVLVAELEIDLLEAAPSRVRFTELPKFPAVTRDIAMLAPAEVPHERIEAVLRDAKEPLLVDVSLFDVFTDPDGQRIPVDKKSVAYALTYRAAERTLTADEVAAAHQRLKERLRAELAVTFRE